MARFYRMLLGGGQLEDKRYLSEAAVKALTSRQTPPDLPQSYGFGLSVSDNTFGHGGAYSTNSFADTERGLILIWLVQHAGFPGEGGKAQGVFKQTAIDTFTRSGQ
jgi:CubicO group peptidase (beta-lactamase class C family)